MVGVGAQDGGVAVVVVMVERRGGRTVGVGTGARMLTRSSPEGTRIDGSRGVTLEGGIGVVLMALENARGETGGIFVQLGGRTAEFEGGKARIAAHGERWNR